MSREEIIFGSDLDVKKFMEEIFFIVGLNLHTTFVDDEVRLMLVNKRLLQGVYFIENSTYSDNTLIDRASRFYEDFLK